MADAEKAPKAMPLPWILISGMLGLFAVSVPNPGTAPKAEDKKPAVVEAVPARITSREPLKPIFDFYNTHDSRWNPEKDLKEGMHAYKTEFMIVTVPDPIDSPFGYAFDQVVDAVQRAVERKDGYLLDRSWLPWELDRKAMLKTKDGPENPDAANLRERQPGVLLFRHGSDVKAGVPRPGLLAVFLVGENSISGLHKKAFTRALNLIAECGQPETEPIRIVGPYFTGSQTSLQFVVGDWWEETESWFQVRRPQYRFEIVTGNASAVRRGEYFSDRVRETGFPGWKPDRVTFQSTVIPTKLILNGILNFLARRDNVYSDETLTFDQMNRIPGRVAILTESNTGFGKAFASLTQQEILMLRFPLHISRVKSEYTRAFRQKDEKNGLKERDPLSVASFDDTQGQGEGIPSQGGEATTATNSQVLARILSTIARERCQYVGVIATDPRDKLFLIRLIREYCPDVHIFVTEADLLLTHPEYRYHMRGVLVGSTYPLVPANQRWVDPANTESILFATGGAQGYYNAALAQLKLTGQLLEYQAPSFVRSRGQDATNALSRPPIWISMVAPNGNLVPLQIYTNYEDNEGYVLNTILPEEEPDIVMPSLRWPGATIPMSLTLGLVWVWLLIRAWKDHCTLLFFLPVHSDVARQRLPNLMYRNLLLGAQCAMLTVVISLLWTEAEAADFTDLWETSILAASLLLLLGLGVAMLKPLRKRAKAGTVKRSVRLWTAWNLLLIAGVGAGCVAFLIRFLIYGDPARRILFFFRSLDLGTGLSPLTPLFFLCLGFSAWAYFQLKRIHISDRWETVCPFPTQSEQCGLYSEVCEADRLIRREIDHSHLPRNHRLTVLVAGIGVTALLGGVWAQSVPTVEGRAWDLMFFVGFSLMIVLMTSTLLHLYHYWVRTNKLFDSIALLPMMRTFTRLPNRMTELFGKFVFSRNPETRHLLVPVHQLRLLGESLSATADTPAELADVPEKAAKIEAALRAMLTARGGERDFRGECDLRRQFSEVAWTCLRAITPRWKSLPVDEAFGVGIFDAEGKVIPNAKTEMDPPWVALAESVIATQVVIYVLQFLMQIRNLVWSVGCCSTLLLLAATSYPFHPERLLLVCLMLMSGTGIVLVIYVLMGISRDELVSRICRTTPGKVSFDSGFLGGILTYVVPIVGIAGAQLSGSFRWLLEPILRVMK